MASIQSAEEARRFSPRLALSALKSNKFLRNAGVISSGSAIGHLFTLAAGPILTRLYSPQEFGGLGLFTTLLSILGVAVTLQYEISIPVGRNEGEAAFLTLGSLLLSVPMSLIGGVTLWGLILTKSLGFDSLPLYTPVLLALSLFFIGLFTALRYWSLREQQFRHVAEGSVMQSAGRAILQSGLGTLGFHPAGLLLGETLGRGLGMSTMLRHSWPLLRKYAEPSRGRMLLQTLWYHRKFPLFSFPSSFLDALCLGLPLPLLVRMYGVAMGGYYSLVWKAISVPSVLVTVAIADTFHSRLASLVRDEPERVAALFRTTSAGLLLAGSVPAFVLGVWGEAIFGWAFGAPWRVSGEIAAIVAPWYLAQFIVSPLSRVVVVLSGQETKLIWDIACLGSLLGVFFWAHSQALPALVTIRLLSIVYTVLFVAYYLLLVHIIFRFEKSRASSQAADR